MANFYFPQAFQANPIQSFIDGKLAGMERVEKERQRQIDLWYKYQNYLMAKEKHAASLAATKQRAAAFDLQTKMLDAYGKGGAGYDGYFDGAASRGSPSASRGDGLPASGGYPGPFGDGYDSGSGTTNVPNLFGLNPGPQSALPDYTGGSGRAAFEAKYGKPMGLGGPKPYETDPGYDEYGLPLNGSTPFDKGGSAYGAADPRIGPDGEFLPQYRGQALDDSVTFGFNGGDAKTQSYLAAVNSRQAPGVARRAPSQPQYDDSPFQQPARRRRRYDPNNTVADEMMLAYFGEY